MELQCLDAKRGAFHRLKIKKKEQLTKNTFAMELEVPRELQENYVFQAGQYVALKYTHQGKDFFNDYSMTSAPSEGTLELGIKINPQPSSTNSLFENYQVGDEIWVSEPRGRFTIEAKPDEFRTIVGFAAGIGITPILSHFKEILLTEPRTRLFLFYGNKSKKDVAYRQELEKLEDDYKERLEVHYFYSQEKIGNAFFEGRLDDHKLKLIINQIMMIDDTDEESTLWDAVDHVLICGKGPMIRSIAVACFEHGIPKKNIHFELFESFNEDIYPIEKTFPIVNDIKVDFKYNGKEYKTVLANNKYRLLQSLLQLDFPLPFSCKSGICGSCQCKLNKGEVELLENEYLTAKEEKDGYILACMSVPLSDEIELDFDNV